MTVEAASISEYWEHLTTGMWMRVLTQDRVKGTVTVREQYPDGRTWYVTLQIVAVEEISNHVCQVD